MTVTVGHDLSKTRKTLTAGGQTVHYYSIPAAEAAGLGEFSKLPASLKVVLENMLRFEDAKTVTVDDIRPSRPGARTAARTRSRSPIARPGC
jgi:aconitate hydratase